jgi:hypothetical protein
MSRYLVEAYGKQHGLVTASLLGKCPANLVLKPVAGDRILRKDQQLVADPDGRVDRVPRLRANRQVVRRKPAAHAGVLQVGMPRRKASLGAS